MKATLLLILLPMLLLATPVAAQETPTSLVTAYDALATIILNARDAEAAYVRAVLDGHRHGARVLMKNGQYKKAAAEMALFANEGDNAMAGVRKRLVEGGHHHNAAGEEQGIYEPGYVVVTREAKQKVMAASAAMRDAADEEAAKAAWQDFKSVFDELLGE